MTIHSQRPAVFHIQAFRKTSVEITMQIDDAHYQAQFGAKVPSAYGRFNPPGVSQLIFVTLHRESNCNCKDDDNVVKSVVFDKDPQLLRLLVQKLLQLIRHLQNLVEVCTNLGRFLVLAADQTNRYGISAAFIRHSSSQDGVASFEGLHFVHRWELPAVLASTGSTASASENFSNLFFVT